MFGRVVQAPRLTACYGEPGTSYRYSGIRRVAEPWSGALEKLAHRCRDQLAHPFNFVLANLYRDGADSVGWHADDERDLGRRPVIATLSLGAARRFVLRSATAGARTERVLEHGSLLLMHSDSQREYRHSVPRTAKRVGERISLTFRRVAADPCHAGPQP